VLAQLFLSAGLGLGAAQALPLLGTPGALLESRAMPAIAPVSEYDRPADARALLRDLNALRAQNGLSPLDFEPRLYAAARAHALDMSNRHYFDHIAPDGTSPLDRIRQAGCSFGYAGENIVLDADEHFANLTLYRSPEHRLNILEPRYERVGIAAVQTDRGEIFVEDFSD